MGERWMKAYFERAGVSGIRTGRRLGDAQPRPADRTPGRFQPRYEVV